MMRFRNEIWIADLNPSYKSEPGKIRPVVIIQTDVLNTNGHESTLICPVTTNLTPASVLRVHLDHERNGLIRPSDILVDQIRSIHNSRFKERLGELTPAQSSQLDRNLAVVLNLTK